VAALAGALAASLGEMVAVSRARGNRNRRSPEDLDAVIEAMRQASRSSLRRSDRDAQS